VRRIPFVLATFGLVFLVIGVLIAFAEPSVSRTIPSFGRIVESDEEIDSTENMHVCDASFEIGKASANLSVRIYVAKGYITEIRGNQALKVMINVESPPEWKNTANGIVGWAFCANVDPEILEPWAVNGNMDGYFLHDFTIECEHEHPCGDVFACWLHKEAGLTEDIAQFILGYKKLGIGAGGNGVLCELLYKCKAEVPSFQIDIYEAYYWTPDGVKHPCDVIDDGHYNVQSLPETNNDLFNSTYNDAKP